jgi:hypothetical protein
MTAMQRSGNECCLVEVISQHLPGGTEEKSEKPVRIACVSHTNLFGGSGLEVNVKMDT